MNNEKYKHIEENIVDNLNQVLTTNSGVTISDNNNTLKAGERGPFLQSDQVYLDKLMHFDRERIPERVVHARGAGAHGIFEATEDLSQYTFCKFLKKGTKTPVFTRFSIVGGSKGASDLARDVRGFAVKFYTDDGNYDLVGNNIPVFFIQDAINFPDLIHSLKPDPNTEIPQASSAHDTFWDFISLMPESTHCIFWLMSDRAIPRSYRMMEGFGVHTFKFINANDEITYVKFHWKPKQGIHSVTWNEAQKISGFDPDFHRRDLWENINNGNYPQWELGVQLISESDAKKLPFDILDSTKLIPEEMVPVNIIGVMTLNKNPENVFAETEQIAFDPGRLVPGIELSEDPLLQGRTFSYMDTQNYRLGGPNFHEIPINKSINGKHNNQSDGFSRRDILKGNVNYFPNSINSGCPYHDIIEGNAFRPYSYTLTGKVGRVRPQSFADHFSQAKLFYNSQSIYEKNHIISSFSFELSKVKNINIRQRMLNILQQVDTDLAKKVGSKLSLKPEEQLDDLTIKYASQIYEDYPVKLKQINLKSSDSLSIGNSPYQNNSLKTKKIAFIITPNSNLDSIYGMYNSLINEKITIQFISSIVGEMKIKSSEKVINIDNTPVTTPSVCYDGVFIARIDSEEELDILKKDPQLIHFINEAYMHCKPICIEGENNVHLLDDTMIKTDRGTIYGVGEQLQKDFIKILHEDRLWDLENFRNIPA